MSTILIEINKKTSFPILAMAVKLDDENKLIGIPEQERFTVRADILKNERDELIQLDTMWIIEELEENKKQRDPMLDKVSKVIELIIRHNNWIVKDKDCFPIAVRNMREKIPLLVTAPNKGSK